jgi:hypothetical protein
VFLGRWLVFEEQPAPFSTIARLFRAICGHPRNDRNGMPHSCRLGAAAVPCSRPVDETVVFLHSEKVCQASSGSTLLDLAERNGVQIPFGCRPGPMWYVCYAGSKRQRSDGRGSRADG